MFVTDFGGFLLANEDMVSEHHAVVVADSAPSAGTVVSRGLPIERENLIIATIQSACILKCVALK